MISGLLFCWLLSTVHGTEVDAVAENAAKVVADKKTRHTVAKTQSPVAARVMAGLLEKSAKAGKISGKQGHKLDATLFGKTDKRQDKEIQEIFAHMKTADLKMNNLRNVEAPLIMTGTTLMNRGQLALNQNMTLSLSAVTDSWQALANEMRDLVVKYQDRSSGEFDVQNEKLQKTYVSVATIFKFQQGKFLKVIDAINAEKKKVMAQMHTNAERIQTTVKKTAVGIRKANKKNTGQTKKMRKVLEKELGASNNNVLLKIGAVNKLVDKVVKKASMEVDGMKTDSRTVAETLKGVKATEEEMKGVALERFDGVVAKSDADFQKVVPALEALSDSEIEHVTTEATNMGLDMRAMAKSTMKAFRDMEREGTKAVKTTVKADKRINREADKEVRTFDKDGKKKMDAGEARVEGAEGNLNSWEEGNDIKVDSLEANIEAEEKNVNHMDSDIKGAINDGGEAMSTKLGDDYEKLGQSIVDSGEMSAEEMRAAKEKLAHNLGAVEESAVEGLGDLKGKLDGFGSEMTEQYEASADWQNEYTDMLGGFGGDVQNWGAESAELLGQMGDDVGDALTDSTDAMDDFGEDLLGSLSGMGKQLGNANEGLAADNARTVKGEEENMARKVGGVEGQMSATLDHAGTEEGQLSNLYSKNNAKQTAENDGAATEVGGVLSGNIPSLEGEQTASANQDKKYIQDMKAGLVSAEMGMANALHGTVNNAKQIFTGSIAAGEEKTATQMDNSMKNTAAQVNGKVNELSALEEAMQSGAHKFGSDADNMEANMAMLKAGAAQVNKDIADRFAHMQGELAADKLAALTTRDELQREMDSRRQKLQALAQSELIGLSEEKKKEFQTTLQERDLKIKAVMEDSTTSFNYRKALLAKIDKDISQSLEEVGEEAFIDEWELEGIARNQSATAESVKRAADMAHRDISSVDILLSGDDDDLTRNLDARAKALKKAVLGDGADLNGEMSGKIDAINEEASNRIKEIKQAAELSDEEKMAHIDKIDSATQNAVATLAGEQNKAGNALSAFAGAEDEVDGAVKSQMAGLENVLKDGQMSWVKSMMEEKDMLRQQSEQLTSLVSNLMSMMDAEHEAAGTQLTQEQAQQKLALQQVRLSMKEMQGKRQSAADEAMQTAVLAQQKGQADKAMTETELEDLQTKLGAMSAKMHGVQNSMWQRIRDEKQARQAAIKGEHQKMLGAYSNILDQLDGIAHVLVSGSATTDTKQTRLLAEIEQVKNKIDSRLSLFEKKMDDQEASLTSAENKLQAEAGASKTWQKEFGQEIENDNENTETTLKSLMEKLADGDKVAQQASVSAGGDIQNAVTKEATRVGSVIEKTEAGAKGVVNDFLDQSKSIMDVIGKGAEAAKAEGDEAYSSLAQDTNQKSSAMSASADALDAQAHRLTSQLKVQDNELAALQKQVSAEVDSQAASRAELAEKTKRELDQLQGRSSLLQTDQESREASMRNRLGQMANRIDNEESEVDEVEKENVELRQKIEDLKAHSL